MIKNFSDHSANERTFLAWVRTAIAVMAFGFLVEKFDLFLLYLTADKRVAAAGLDARIVGLGLVALGVIMVVIATIRFVVTERQIDAEASGRFHAVLLNLLLMSLLVMVGLFLLLYLSHHVPLPRPG